MSGRATLPCRARSRRRDLASNHGSAPASLPQPGLLSRPPSRLIGPGHGAILAPCGFPCRGTSEAGPCVSEATASEGRSQRKRVLIVDDDDSLRQTLAEQLELHQEFAVAEAPSAPRALDAVKSDLFDVILLDVGLPDMDGRELCRLMRRSGAKCPIIMLTAADTDADQILGLDAGANDYVAKPFRLNVLLARLRAQLRQHEQSEDATFAIGPYLFRPSGKLLLDRRSQKKVRLTEKETSILKYLYRAGEKPVGRDVLLNEVWGYNPAVTTHTLETHVYRLRQKIESDPARAEILVTEAGGYRLVV
ncbi:MAG: response regulator transcription factor [Alphaproteobacteria bacterium]|nr:response regulator transcription factor [Alphaproteobacteria bacterium]